ncbi:hypothetical protein SS1G_09885 [Sclerotinia sclerotiorum 1980 UF-70]|uniref:Cation-transporting P-type ATPase N-terminal domain-containing protein n=1 Tax=Sclerotinia sclerotiorum (strain ATCC 18683 / 1980 / Ss-1) TaxID=665079 RepID=A7EX26_SCLS1|nr:hypothetical protein SS1G_09885 [Sclerotinia sclerotiorum 1980 UF-70]EDN94018.1 hypothetical protein SS1G_09885 [Sclerotinia sclerotiorum 1980 UF-70]
MYQNSVYDNDTLITQSTSSNVAAILSVLEQLNFNFTASKPPGAVPPGHANPIYRGADRIGAMSWPHFGRSGSPSASLLPMANLPSGNDRLPISEPSSRPRSRDRADSKSRHTRSSSAVAKVSERPISAEPERTPTNTTNAQQSIADEFSALTPMETAERLQTSLTSGLTPAEALSRLHDQGPNELPLDPPEPLWLRFIKQFKETLILLLLGSAVMSVIAGNKDDAISIAVAVTIVVTVGFVQEYRSEKSIEALNHLVPNHAHIIRGEMRSATPRTPAWPPSARKIPEMDSLMADSGFDADSSIAEIVSHKTMASKLVPGDLVLFTTGDRIPADIRVTKASDLTIDESNLTGENEPVRITAEARHMEFRPGSSSLEPPSLNFPSPAGGNVGADISLNSTTNIAFMGTLVRSGHGQGIVYATGGDTHFGTIAASVSETESPRTPLQLSMDALGNQLSQASFVIIAVISLVGWLQGKAWLDIFTISISLAVAAIPEGLPIIVTVTLALGVHRMARHNAIVRKMPSVETLGSVNVVCSDKTGTLTMNHMTTVKMWYFDAEAPLDVDSDDETVEAKADTVALRILRIGNIANNARLTHLHAPSASSVAILSSTQGRASNQILKSRWVGQPTDVAMLDMLDRFKEHDVREGLGQRIGETPFSSEKKWMGVTIGDLGPEGTSSPKEHAYIKGAIERVLERLVQLPDTQNLWLHQVEAERHHSINSAEVRPVLRGDEIDDMTAEELQTAIAHTSVFARTSPDHKMKIIRALQARGDIVAMTGDGVNDAPALKKADIGISMGLQGTDVAKEAADMILTDDDFSTILKAIEEGKGIFSNIKNFLTFQLSTSAAALSLVSFGLVDIIMDGPPAQSLGVEPVDPDVMNKPPRVRNAPVLTRALIARVLTSATIIMLGTMAVYTHEMLSDGQISKRDTTMTFTCFVLFDMFNALNCRSESKSVLRGEVGLFSNKLFNWSVSLSLGGQILVIYFPWLQEVFQTEALALTDLVGLVILTSSVFWADEARKWWKYRSRRTLGSGYSQIV